LPATPSSEAAVEASATGRRIEALDAVANAVTDHVAAVEFSDAVGGVSTNGQDGGSLGLFRGR
jgi:hypothetical protein